MIKFVESNPKFCPIPNGRLLSSANGLKVLITDESETGKHLSISHASRYPTWDEIKDAVYELLPPNKTYAMYFPPKEQFVNVHPNCFHVYEVKE